jgi:serine/threonine-protein kinase
MSVADRLRSVFRIFLLLTVLVAVALISAITTIRITLRSRQENMPKLLGVPLESAERMAAQRGLQIKVEDKIYSAQYAADEIAQQMPPPGTPLKMGQHVHVLVSLGPPQVIVPDLVGDSMRAARINAVQRGLTVGDVMVIPWTGDPDVVVAQDPPAAAAEVRTPTVNLLLSAGTPQIDYLCPRFIGQSVAQVRPILERNGFKVGQITPIATPDAVSGTILAQSPPSGSKIGSDAIFSFQVVQ